MAVESRINALFAPPNEPEIRKELIRAIELPIWSSTNGNVIAREGCRAHLLFEHSSLGKIYTSVIEEDISVYSFRRIARGVMREMYGVNFSNPVVRIRGRDDRGWTTETLSYGTHIPSHFISETSVSDPVSGFSVRRIESVATNSLI